MNSWLWGCAVVLPHSLNSQDQGVPLGCWKGPEPTSALPGCFCASQGSPGVRLLPILIFFFKCSPVWSSRCASCPRQCPALTSPLHTVVLLPCQQLSESSQCCESCWMLLPQLKNCTPKIFLSQSSSCQGQEDSLSVQSNVYGCEAPRSISAGSVLRGHTRYQTLPHA